MKTKQKILLCLLLSFLPVSVFSQINYYNGYYINNSGDSIQGLIKNNGDLRNLKYFLFKEAKGMKSLKHYPDEIRSYKIEGKRYYVSDGDQFKEVLIEGRLSLYVFSNDADQRYSLRKPDGNMTTLVNEKTMFSIGTEDKRFYVVGDSSSIDLDNYPGLEFQKGKYYYGEYNYSYNVFKDTLHHVFAESKDMQDQIDKIIYSDKSLTAAISEFNKQTCSTGSCISYEKDFGLYPYGYGFYTGLGISKIFFTESNIESAYEISAPYIGTY
nr:hypothetical protein [Bacteroidales bacterium]